MRVVNFCKKSRFKIQSLEIGSGNIVVTIFSDLVGDVVAGKKLLPGLPRFSHCLLPTTLKLSIKTSVINPLLDDFAAIALRTSTTFKVKMLSS